MKNKGRKHSSKVRLELEALEHRDLMSGGLTCTSPVPLPAGCHHHGAQVSAAGSSAGMLVTGVGGNGLGALGAHSGSLGGLRGNHNETLVRHAGRRGKSRRS
jgi:hypothetical protein